MLSHSLGLVGELLNLVGALVLALDIFLRKQERQREEQLKKIAEIARKHGISRTIYKGFSVTDSKFPWSVLDSRATTIAYIGAAFLASGFMLLSVHHGIELRGEMNQSAVKCVSCDNICPKNGF